MKKLLFAIATLPLFAAPLCAQTLIGFGATSSVSRERAGPPFAPGSHAGGIYVEAAQVLLKSEYLDIGAYGVIYDEPFAKGLRPGARVNVALIGKFLGEFKPFVAGGLNFANIPAIGTTIYNPVLTGGIEYKGITLRTGYLFAASDNSQGLRAGFDISRPLYGKFNYRISADTTHFHNAQTVIVVSAGLAYRIK